MIQKTYFTYAQIDGASDIRFHGTLGMIAKHGMDVVINHFYIGVDRLTQQDVILPSCGLE
jgi:hypothetical protein